MALTFQTLIVRAPRRVRLLWSGDTLVYPDAYDPAFYSFTSVNALGSAPVVAQAIVVPNSPDSLELALDVELVPGGRYTLEIAPGVRGAVSTAGGSSTLFEVGKKPVEPSPELKSLDVLGLAYGVDLLHDGTDMVEEANGDLASISGPANAKQALKRLVESGPLAWDTEYSPKVREFVDAPSPLLGKLRGVLVRKLLRDDRVRTADARSSAIEGSSGVQVDLTVKLVGDVDASQSVQVSGAQ